jgi:hypothetical protein
MITEYKQIRIGAFNQSIMASCNYEKEEGALFSLVWGDPNSIEIRNEAQTRAFIEEAIKEEDQTHFGWACHTDRAQAYANTWNVDEMIDHLKESRAHSVQDTACFLSIRLLMQAW